MGSDGVKIAAAIAAGYLIGRTRKARLVVAVAAGVLLAGRGLSRLGLDESRLGGVLTEVLGDVQRSAGEALNARVGQLSDSLRSQTEGLGGGLGLGQEESGEEEEGESDEEAPAASEGEEDQPRDEESDEAGEEEEEAPQPSRRPDAGRAARTGGRRVAQATGRGRR